MTLPNTLHFVSLIHLKFNRSREPKHMSKIDPREPMELHRKAASHMETLWDECKGKFMKALADSGREKVNVSFKVTLDLSESAPVVDTEISFRDKCKEGGMNVNKTFRKSISEECEDPSQPPLPGMEAARGGPIDTEGQGEEPEALKPAKKRNRSKKKE